VNNILNITFEEGKIIAKAGGLWQWDKGQKIRVFGTGITQDAEIHFSLMEKGGSSATLTGTYDSSLDALIADIPDRYLGQDSLIDYKLYAFIYVRSDESSAETVYKIIMTVKARPKPDGYDAAVVPSAPYIVEFDTVGSGSSALCTCRQTFADVIDALASGRSVMAVEYRYSQSTDDDPYQTRYHCLMGVGTSQIKFGENGLTFMSSRDPAYGDAWMITAPYIILKSNGSVVRTSATGSPAMMGDINALASSMTETYKVTFYRTRADGDSYIVTCDRTLEDITAAFEADKYVFAEVQTSYDNGETFAVTEACLPCIDSGNQNFIFGWNGMYLLHEDNPDQSDSWETHYSCYELRYNYQTQQEEAVHMYGTTCHATLTDLNALTDCISALEARVAALEGGN
jgi:hypothetical protein